MDSRMDIGHRMVDGVLVFDIEDDAPLHERTRRDWFYSEIKEHARAGSGHVLMNLSRARFLNEIDIGILIRAAKLLNESRGSIGLVVNLRLAELFRVCWFGPSPFIIFDSEEEAFACFRKHGSFRPG